MTTTTISALFGAIRTAVSQGELSFASTLSAELGAAVSETGLPLTDEEEQFLDWIHGYSIHREKFKKGELDPDLYQMIQDIKTDGPPVNPNRLASLMRDTFSNQGKYPFCMMKGEEGVRVLYWYFQNMPWNTSIRISVKDEKTQEEMWYGTVSHRDMATVLHPDTNPHLFWADLPEWEVNNRVMGYKAWKQWRLVHRV